MDVDTEYKTIGKLFEKAKTSTANFQQQFDKLKVQETILITLRDRYHEALATKKFHENERDTYFSHDMVASSPVTFRGHFSTWNTLW